MRRRDGGRRSGDGSLGGGGGGSTWNDTNDMCDEQGVINGEMQKLLVSISFGWSS